jgi:two-component system chemotaxis sensor kinase CheA
MRIMRVHCVNESELNGEAATAGLGDDIVKEFLVESYENLDQLDRDLVTLEQDPASQPTLSSIFRTVHTIKGTCGFLGFGKLECVAHVGENLLSKLRDGELQLRSDITTGLLHLVDAIREILANIETLGAEGEADYTELVQTLIQLQGGPLEDAFANTSLDCTPPASPVAETTLAASTEPFETADETPPDSRDHAGASGDARQGGLSDSTIRVDVGLLDKLMNRVGELVLARNQVLQFTTAINDAAFLSTSQRLNLITTELQEGVMKTRMQQIGNLWSKFPRVVRDLALQCGKQMRIEMEGKETELDKTIVEAIKDPLTHLVRNAVDHGMESPEARLAAGKPAEGCLRLRAFHEGGQVNIEIVDDGAGLNLVRIRQKAVERGIVTPDQALRLSDRDVSQLIFAPGFSTASQVTNISGRGVGMDVVKTNVEKIGGTVDIHSQPGRGTTVKLKIPLTLAIIPALVVTCDGDRYAIPQVSLLELVRLEGEQARRGIERLHGAPVYRLRGQLLPIVYLRKELGLDSSPPAASSPHAASKEITAPSAMPIDHEVLNIVVLRADDRQFGLVVDSINDTEEIVVKPLSQQLKSIPVYAGATIMGDGRVALILDVLGTAQRARVVSEVRDRALAGHSAANGEQSSARQTLLVLEVGNRRLALPISMVSRLEEIPAACIERADQQEVVQYRGQIMPLLKLGPMLGIATNDDNSLPLQVVVYSEGRRSVGLVVDRIADIVESAVDVSRQTQSDDLLASAVIQQRVTDLLNLPALIRRSDPTFFDAPTAVEGTPA